MLKNKTNFQNAHLQSPATQKQGNYPEKEYDLQGLGTPQQGGQNLPCGIEQAVEVGQVLVTYIILPSGVPCSLQSDSGPCHLLRNHSGLTASGSLQSPSLIRPGRKDQHNS